MPNQPTGMSGASSPFSRAQKRSKSIIFLIGVAVILAFTLGLSPKLEQTISSQHDAPTSHLHKRQGGSNFIPINELVDSSQFTLDPKFVITSVPTTRVYNWTVTKISGAPLGVEKSMLVVNGMSPGPNIEANTGDRIIVHVTNGLSDTPTSLHWHGLFQNGTSYYDGSAGITQCGIPPGETMTYNFTLDGNFTGTTWWHAHYATQYTDGLFGALIVHNPTENVPKYDGDIVLTLADLYNTWSPDLLSAYLADDSDEPANEPVADGGIINGIGQFSLYSQYPNQTNFPSTYFNLTLEANKTYRLRLINTGSFAAMRFSVDNHTLTVIEADGTPVDSKEVAGVSLQVAQRYSVLLKTNKKASAYWMRATVDDSMYTATNPGLVTNQLGVIRYSSVSNTTMPDPGLANNDPGPGKSLKDLNPNALVPADIIAAPQAASSVPVSFSIQRTSDQNWRAFFNNTSWDAPNKGQATQFLDIVNTTTGDFVGAVDDSNLVVVWNEVAPVDLIINNLDDGDHPFHLHGHKPWIMGHGNGQYNGQPYNTTNPMRRDTFLVPAYTWMTLRFWVDHAGYWALHCHLQWHMAAGGLMQVVSLPERLSVGALPQDMTDQCAVLEAKGS